MVHIRPDYWRAVALGGDAGAVVYEGYTLIPQNDALAAESQHQPYGEMYMNAGFRVKNSDGREYGIYSALIGFNDKDGCVWYLLRPDRWYWNDAFVSVDFDWLDIKTGLSVDKRKALRICLA